MSEWVKCSERQPEEDGRYLVCEKYSSDSHWIGVWLLHNGKWNNPKIIAWQPLPEPPRDE